MHCTNTEVLNISNYQFLTQDKLNFPIDPYNENPRSLELFFVSLQSLSYQGYVKVLYDSFYKHKEGRACTASIYLDHSYTLDLKASQTASNPALF